MALRKRAGTWHYRFKLKGLSHAGSTGLEATRQNENAAKAIEAQARLNAKNGLVTPRQAGVPFDAAAEEFLDWCKTTEYRSSPRTAQRIHGSFASIREFFGHLRVHEITAGAIERYKTWRIAEQHVKDCTLRNDLFNFSIFFDRYARKHNWCTSNPIKDITKPSNEDAVRMHILTKKEEAAYFAALKPGSNTFDVGRLMILQGCRPEEVMALRRENYDRTKKQIRITVSKTKAGKRTLDLCDESIKILDRRTRETDNEWLFPSDRIRGQHVKQLATSHNQACADSGVECVLYDLRHTFATRMVIEAKVDIATLATLLGHSGLRVVQKYLHPTAEHKKEAMRKYQRTFGPERKPKKSLK